MSQDEQVTGHVTTKSVSEPNRLRTDGPFWLALLLSAGGLVYVLFGSVTIVPWIPDERTRQTVRSVWLALSRNLPDLGPDTLVRFGFWVIVALIGALSVGLMVMASAVRDDADSSGESPV